MPSQPHEYSVERGPRPARAHLTDYSNYQPPPSAYQLSRADELRREMGYVRQDDGTWQLPDG